MGSGKGGMAMKNVSSTERMIHALLHLMALNFNLKPSLRQYLRSNGSWINFSIGFKTFDESMKQCIVFENGKVKVPRAIPEEIDACMVFASEQAVKKCSNQSRRAIEHAPEK